MCRKPFLSFTVVVAFILFIFLMVNPKGEKQPVVDPLTIADGCTGIGNPAYEYCTTIMGYEYQEVTGDDGRQDGVCMMPDGVLCPQWDFYAGTCGSSFSYCAQNGMGLETRIDGKDPFSNRYGFCVDNHGKYLGTYWSLAGLIDINTDPNVTYPPFVPGSPTLPDDFGQVIEVPGGFDWRDHAGFNWMTPVKNQRSCGSCWAFSAVGAAEAQINIISENPHLDLDLSEQYLISDCFPLGNCNGGSEYLALYQIYKTGLPDEDCYPYLNRNSSCLDRCSDYRERLEYLSYANFLHEPDYTEQDIKIILSHTGPVVLTIGTYIDGINAYWDGDIYRCRNDYPDGGTSRIDHGVVAVGYNDEEGYWVVKNSWGATWNGTGYFKLGYNECNVAHSRISWGGYSPPKAVYLSVEDVPEGRHFNTVVGILESDDLDADDAHTYDLVQGEGDDDNHLFNISGNKLRASGIIDMLERDTLSIRIRSTDIGGQYLEEVIQMIVVEGVPTNDVFIPMLMLGH